VWGKFRGTHNPFPSTAAASTPVAESLDGDPFSAPPSSFLALPRGSTLQHGDRRLVAEELYHPPAQTFPWILFAASVLGLGLMLGAYWAYEFSAGEVLGMGSRGKFLPRSVADGCRFPSYAACPAPDRPSTSDELALALVTFLLVLYSTFLTRSGSWAMPRSFLTDPGAVVFAFSWGPCASDTRDAALPLSGGTTSVLEGRGGLVTRETMLGRAP